MKDIVLSRISFILSLFVLIFSFLLFYSQTAEWVGSLAAAFLSSGLVYGACVTIKWLIEVFSAKNDQK